MLVPTSLFEGKKKKKQKRRKGKKERKAQVSSRNYVRRLRNGLPDHHLTGRAGAKRTTSTIRHRQFGRSISDPRLALPEASFHIVHTSVSARRLDSESRNLDAGNPGETTQTASARHRREDPLIHRPSAFPKEQRSLIHQTHLRTFVWRFPRFGFASSLSGRL